MKILMIFPGMIDDLPPILSSASCLSKLGATVTVCAFGCNGETKELLEVDNVKILSIDCKKYPNSVFSKIKKKLEFRRMFRNVLRHKEFDVFWLHGAHALGLINHLPVRKIIVAHAHELYETFRYKIMQKRGIKKSHLLIVPEENRKWFLQLSVKKTIHSFVIPNRIQKEFINVGPESCESFATQAFMERGGSKACSRFLLYQGLLGKGRCLHSLIEGFVRVEDKSIGLILIGDGPDKQYIQYIKDLATCDKRIVFLDKIPHPGHLKVTSGCFGGILLYAPISLNNVYCAPNKIYEYASCGLGMLLPDFPGMKKIVDRYDIGVTCDPNDVSSIQDGIERLILGNTTTLKNNAKKFLSESPTVESEYLKVYSFIDRQLH